MDRVFSLRAVGAPRQSHGCQAVVQCGPGTSRPKCPLLGPDGHWLPYSTCKFPQKRCRGWPSRSALCMVLWVWNSNRIYRRAFHCRATVKFSGLWHERTWNALSQRERIRESETSSVCMRGCGCEWLEIREAAVAQQGGRCQQASSLSLEDD
jgi:hypothetical protein